jgi:hypothetical protein
MMYDKLTKGDDGLYHVRAFTDDRKKHFVQLNDVTITDTGDDFAFEVSTPEKVDVIHDMNIQNAIDNSQEWFGKKLTEKTLRSAYTREETLSAERLQNTKVFSHDKALIDFDILQPGDVCSVIVEFSGLWFAKKAFGPSWNIVQVKMQQTVEKFDETYPEDYMFEDEE